MTPTSAWEKLACTAMVCATVAWCAWLTAGTCERCCTTRQWVALAQTTMDDLLRLLRGDLVCLPVDREGRDGRANRRSDR